MKFIIKYVYILALFPMLLMVNENRMGNKVFLMSCSNLKTELAELKNIGIKKEQTIAIVVKVNVHSNNKDFTATGFPVILYNEKYEKIAESQVINGRVLFQVKPSEIEGKKLIAVSTRTNDETKVIPDTKNVLNIYYTQVN
jgi:nitrous oxidase accessory protein NosD